MYGACELEISGRRFKVELDPSSPVAAALRAFLPLQSSANNIGGEIWFRIHDADIEYDGTQKDEFQPGDITYWRSPSGERKFAIAIFYGNTQFSEWRSPRASSPCVAIGRILGAAEDFRTVQTGEPLRFGRECSCCNETL